MEEEVDYMSDEFLAKCLDNKSDVRPGLLKTHNQQREHNLMKKKKEAMENKKKSPQELQIESLEESLKQPISSANKGFSMLAKMGFKSGMGLGKNSTGIVEPIGINIKNDKRGLGLKKPEKRLKKSTDSNKEDKISESDFRAFLSRKNRERETLSDLRKSQRMCRELDITADKNEPEESWFWPDVEVSEDEEGDKEEDDTDDSEKEVELSNEEKLEMLTKYLRENYYYCVWCKVKYENEEDMDDCPGVTRDEH